MKKAAVSLLVILAILFFFVFLGAKKAEAVQTSVTVVSQQEVKAQLVSALIALIEQLQQQIVELQREQQEVKEEVRETRERVEREEEQSNDEAPEEATPDSVAREYGFTIVEKVELEGGRTKLWLNTGQGVGLDLNAPDWEETLRATFNRIK